MDTDGHLRHSKFVGLRDDKDPRWVVKEERAGNEIERRGFLFAKLETHRK
jgi:hypothetical protein